jgi:hypothetical protein
VLTLNDKKFDRQVTLREAYFMIFEFLEQNWQKDNSVEIGQVLSNMALWSTDVGKAPMDAAVLPEFIASCEAVREEIERTGMFARANISFVE